MQTETLEFPKIRTCYQGLMSEYILLLRQVASSSIPWVLRWTLRQMIEDHIRVIILDIKEAFTLYEFYFLNSAHKEVLDWLRQEEDFLTRLADQLANYRQRLLTIAWRGLTLLFASAVLEIAGPTNQPQDINFVFGNLFRIVQTILFSSGGLLFFIFSISWLIGPLLYGIKRSIIQHNNPDIYRIENELFQLLEREKPGEQRYDVWVLVFLCVIAIVGLVIFLGYLPDALRPEASTSERKFLLAIIIALVFIITMAAVWIWAQLREFES